ncbi:MAG: hypothetical protein EOS72_03245 [Mesorhizobium sp.]|uniref:hypothetical protein n=1 Tax=Mesorhizobium sp. TaxID=1871066 RepID=UPI000FEA960E|nr:hypothetical protein [Mesorhizobium sp.]RWC91684.1 MAG: hypothetical protein EOS72_03245 [Mesorhizobium sp.]
MSDPVPKILFIDAASRYGWARGRPGEMPESGSARFAREGASQGAVAWGAMSFIANQVQTYRPDEIVIEAPLPATLVNGKTSLATQEILMGLPFAIQGMAYGLQAYNVSVARVSKIRTHFIGKNSKGEIAKPAVWRKCLALGWVSSDDEDLSHDRTDALAGWSYAGTVLCPQLAQPVDDLFVKAEERKRNELAASKPQPTFSERF